MKFKKWTAPEAFYNFHCEIALNDFFRGMKALILGEVAHASRCLYFADMTDEPLNLEGLDDKQVERQLDKCL